MSITSKAIEIEQKFRYSMVTLVPKLRAMNATFVGTKTFIDKYYDTSSWFLLKQNIFLRNRAMNWETKEGLHSKHFLANKDVASSVYKETEGNDKVIIELKRFFHCESNKNTSVEEFIKEMNLSLFANIETTRTTYKINDHTKIDLDDIKLYDIQSDKYYPYSIGEVEIMASNTSEKSKVEEEINSVRDALGVGRYNPKVDKVPSKLDQYLYLWRREVYDDNLF
ncbi:hypothetical protein WA158_000683 [Blastocystis sp. Blastoise]